MRRHAWLAVASLVVVGCGSSNTGPGVDGGGITLPDSTVPVDVPVDTRRVDRVTVPDTSVAVVCGDNMRATNAEECDDGNTANGDGCSSMCRVESGTCENPLDFMAVSTVEGNARVATAPLAKRIGFEEGSCGAVGGEAAFRYTAPSTGTLILSSAGSMQARPDTGALIPAGGAIYVRSTCGDIFSEISCNTSRRLGSDFAESEVQVTAGQTIFIFFDVFLFQRTDAMGQFAGYVDIPSGTFRLSAQLIPTIARDGTCDPTGETNRCVPGDVCTGTAPTCQDAITTACGSVAPTAIVLDGENRGTITGVMPATSQTGLPRSSCEPVGATGVLHSVQLPATDGRWAIVGSSTGGTFAMMKGCLGGEFRCGYFDTMEGRPLYYFIDQGTYPSGGTAYVLVSGTPGTNYRLDLSIVRVSTANGDCFTNSGSEVCAENLICRQPFAMVRGDGGVVVADGGSVDASVVDTDASILDASVVTRPEASVVDASRGDAAALIPGICMPAVCGNKMRENNEQCDDGNALTGDICSPDCKLTAFADSCATPIDLNTFEDPTNSNIFTVFYSSVGGMDHADPPAACAMNFRPMVPDRIFRWVPPATGSIVAVTQGITADFSADPNHDTVMYAKSDCAAAAVLMCNDDAQMNVLASRLQLPVTAGTPIYFFVDGWSAPGAFVLQVQLTRS